LSKGMSSTVWLCLCGLGLIAFACAQSPVQGARHGILPPSSLPNNLKMLSEIEQSLTTAETKTHRSRRNRKAEASCFGDDDANSAIVPAIEDASSLLELEAQAKPGEYGQFFMKLVPGVHGKLYGRSLVAPCRCEACAYVLDTLVMYLDEDTMGWFLPDDVEHVIQDRFCYGVKWIYRSACHHILSAYYEEIVTMVMGHLTGVDMCRVLRFCPFHFSSGNWMWPQKSPLAASESQ